MTGFPTTLCRADLEADGAPGLVLDVVNWPPNCGATTTSTTSTTAGPTTTLPGTLEVEELLAIFIAAWDTGDFARMGTVADPAVVQFAQGVTVPGGRVLPPPPRGRCFFLAPVSCEVAYGTDAGSTIYRLEVTDRIISMAVA